MGPTNKSVKKRAKVEDGFSGSSVKKSKNGSLDSSENMGTVQSERVRILKEGKTENKGPVIYWMFRDQRSRGNWALIHAIEQANRMHVPVAVVFNLFDQFLGAKARHFGFMLRGLCELQRNLKELGIPFFLLQGQAVETIPKFLKQCDASVLIVDFSPLRIVRKWKVDLCKKVTETISVHEVDAHNIVPVWVASEKLEYSARTIRSKIHRLLPEYLIEFPDTRIPIHEWKDEPPAEIDWENLIGDVVSKGADVPEVQWCEPGENAAMDVLLGSKNGFLSTRLKHYSTDRNNPLKPKALSGLSPYLHFGQISAQICALKARTFRNAHPQLWNASQLEMVHYGKMHGFMRMYWAKKILEWTSGPQEALSIAIYLNDKYELDGRDPSGYVGCMWSICGVHDQGWQERPVFGKIRYMNYAGCKRKFDVDGYIAYVKRMVGEIKKQQVDKRGQLIAKKPEISQYGQTENA